MTGRTGSVLVANQNNQSTGLPGIGISTIQGRYGQYTRVQAYVNTNKHQVTKTWVVGKKWSLDAALEQAIDWRAKNFQTGEK